MRNRALLLLAIAFSQSPSLATGQIAVRGKMVHTMAGPAIRDGVVLLEGGKIKAVGSARDVRIPSGYRVLNAEVVTPGLIDARTSVGLSGMANLPGHDQDHIERSASMQPELRAIDAFNPLDPLVAYLRGFGVTTVHTGHSAGSLISGQTAALKTWGNTVEKALLQEVVTVSATLDPSANRPSSPGNRSKQVALLRAELLKAREGLGGKEERRDLRKEMFARLLRREIPLMIYANRSQDILNALRIAKEFDLRLILEGASEAYLVAAEIKSAGIPVIVHPTMARPFGDNQNLTYENASLLHAAGISIAFQSGFEGYVPKNRVVLFEAAIAAANGLTFEQTLEALTIGAARMLNIHTRVGSLEVGKDADLALYDGDPFEYTSHCVGVIIDGVLVSSGQ